MSTVTNGVAAPPERKPKVQTRTWTAHNIFLKLHLYLGLVSAVFLLILGVTGAIIGFEQEIPRWLHHGRWYVSAQGEARPESELIQNVEQRFRPARVRVIMLPPSRGLAQLMQLGASTPGSPAALRVFVNPYDGSILGTQTGATTDEKVLAAIHSFHLRIGLGDTGKLIVSIAGLILCFEILFGLVLWFRLQRATVRWSGSWFRIFFDLHNAVGIYSAAFLLLAALTGIVIGFDFMEPLIFKITKSEPLLMRRFPNSSPPAGGANPISVDQAIAIARRAMPEASLAMIQLPANPRASFTLGMRVPEETSPAVHSAVSVDQYSGQVLRIDRFKSSMGYRVIRFNRSLHTGDVLGLPGHIVMSVSSLVLVLMVLTGIVIWWKKLAI